MAGSPDDERRPDPALDLPALELMIAGFRHETCPAALRERLYLEDDEAGGVERQILEDGIESAFVLSTCDRVDVVSVAAPPHLSIDQALNPVLKAAGAPHDLISAHGEVVSGEAAFRYLCRVASGMESQVVGEAQVLGQLKAAHRRAEAAGHIHPDLLGHLQAVYRTAKRVRTETAIGAHSVSLVGTAVDVVQQLHGSLDRVSGVLVGSGDMGVLIVEALQRAGLDRWTVVGRSPRRAKVLADQVGTSTHVTLDALPDVIERGDVVVTALGEGPSTLSTDRVTGALRRRKRRPMFFIDVGVPADVEPAVHKLDDAFVYTLDDLSALAEEGLHQRRATLAEADRIIDEETKRFYFDRAGRVAVPTIQALQDALDQFKADAAGHDPSPETIAALDRFAARVLHHPANQLRKAAQEGTGQLEGSLRRLFQLGRPKELDKD